MGLRLLLISIVTTILITTAPVVHSGIVDSCLSWIISGESEADKVARHKSITTAANYVLEHSSSGVTKSDGTIVPINFRIEKVKGNDYRIKYLLANGEDAGGATYRYKNGEISNIVFWMTKAQFKRQGVSKLIFAKMLVKHPDVRKIKSSLVADNADAYWKALQSGMSKEDALKEMPAYKLGKLFGFLKVLKLAEKYEYDSVAKIDRVTQVDFVVIPGK